MNTPSATFVGPADRLLPPSSDRSMRRLARAVRSGKPPALSQILAAWPVSTRPQAATRAARWAISAGQPEQLAMALDWAPGLLDDGGFGRYNGGLVAVVLAQSEKWKGLSGPPALPGKEPPPGPALCLLDVLASKGVPLEDPLGTPAAHPLLIAVQADLLEEAAWLLDHGVDPNGRYLRPDPDGHTLHSWPPVAFVKSVGMARLLFSRGARAGAAPPNGTAGCLVPLASLGSPVPELLPEIIAAWREHGGRWDEPMESSKSPSFTLAELAFGLGPSLFASTPAPTFEPLQMALLVNGFDPSTLAPDGRSYYTHAMERGSPQARQWVLDHALPGAGAPIRPGPRL